MTDIPVASIFNYFIFLIPPFLFGLLVKKIKLSPIVGYILGGLFLGNIFNGVFSKEAINQFAYFGIILLLFTVGLEINFGRILQVKKYIIIGGTIQIGLSIIFILFLSIIFSFTLLQSFLIGIALASSSTVLVAKIIQDKGEESSFIGEIAIGILMFQDIAFIPFLIIFTSVSIQSTSFLNVSVEVIMSLLKSIFIIGIMVYAGRILVPQIFNRIAKTSRELLNLFIILFIFFITYLSLLLNIPILIGVFVAGILVGQTIEHYHVFSEMRPMRDLLAVVFFVYIGLNIQLASIFISIPSIILFSISVVFIKAMIIFITFLFMKLHSRTAFSLSMYLFQVDEDAFILFSVMYANKLLSHQDYLFLISTVLVTLIVTPIFIQKKEIIYIGIRKWIKSFLPFIDTFITYRFDQNRSPLDDLHIKNHIVICGYGRIGNYIGKTLLMSNIPFVAIDYNFSIVEKTKKEGVTIIYGDPSDIDILDYAQVDEARILILAIPEWMAQEQIIINAKKLNKNIIIISRIHKQHDHHRMKSLGADVLVQPEFEASLSIIKKILLWYQLPKVEIIQKIKRLKDEYGLV